ncbi:MAG: flippase activity-associated protein Agl23 [Halolamina sp.]|uniref:flippase activity-associated protein Agl23 n=1 Tax=Halolamina sp. TaxID=1940283 RepID=UPI002FC39C93
MRRPDRVTLAVLTVTLLALLARAVGLGARPFHWDEARVGYWTLRSLAVGAYEYRPVAGGPFLYIVGRWLFTAVGAGDAVARAIVALIGGLLPLSALLFRAGGLRPGEDREPCGSDTGTDTDATQYSVNSAFDSALRRRSTPGLTGVETVSLSVILGFAPPLLYYSRVFRADLPLAALGFVAFGFFHRARARGTRRLFYAGALAFGLGLTTSGFALAMIACWLVAALLVFDEGRVRGDSAGVILGRVRRVGRTLSAWTAPVLRATLLAIGVVLVFYVPRGVIDFARPRTLLSALEAGSLGAGNRFLAVLVLGRHAPPTHMNGHPLLPFVGGTLETLLATALPVVALALWGFVRERYGGRSRPAVSFGTYWAGIGLLVFPAVTEVNEPWVAVHILVPMALPAAVGLATVWRYGREHFARGDAMRVATALLLLSATGVHAGAVVAGEVYDDPDARDDLPGFAQPEAELRPAMAAATTTMEGNDGTDVLYVGERFLLKDESVLERPPVPEESRDAFSARLPLSWYVERAEGETASVASPDAVPEDPPPVVVTTPRHAPALSERFEAYQRYRVTLGLTDRTVVVYIAE